MVMRLCFVMALVAFCGCARISGTPESQRAGGVAEGPMTQTRMEMLFADQVDAIVGPPGSIQTRIDGVNVYLISDPANDRMRIMAPIVLVEKLDPRVFDVLLKANFHSTLDARYAVSEGIIYAAFLHPISSLSPVLLESALTQVLSLVKTFGSSFSSGELTFGSPPATGR
jgi:hypothetical protein